MTRNPDLWSLFGSDVSDDMGKFGHLGEDAGTQRREGNYELLGDEFVHDGLNRAIISYGVVPLFVVGLVGFVVLIKLHRAQFSIQSQDSQKLIKASMALLFGVASVTLTSQQAITIQPINLFVFMWCGVFMVILQCSKKEDFSLAQAEESEEK